MHLSFAVSHPLNSPFDSPSDCRLLLQACGWSTPDSHRGRTSAATPMHTADHISMLACHTMYSLQCRRVAGAPQLLGQAGPQQHHHGTLQNAYVFCIVTHSDSPLLLQAFGRSTPASQTGKTSAAAAAAAAHLPTRCWGSSSSGASAWQESASLPPSARECVPPSTSIPPWCNNSKLLVHQTQGHVECISTQPTVVAAACRASTTAAISHALPGV